VPWPLVLPLLAADHGWTEAYVAVEVDLVVAADLGTLGTAGAVGRAAAPDLGMQLVAASVDQTVAAAGRLVVLGSGSVVAAASVGALTASGLGT
jgi:glycogen synthase